MMKTSEVLNNSADLIDERGHSKGTYVGSGGEVCALGAIMITCGASVVVSSIIKSGFRLAHEGRTQGQYNSSEAARNRLKEYLYFHADEAGWNRLSDSIPNWNDGNDAETVVRVMREAAQWSE